MTHTTQSHQTYNISIEFAKMHMPTAMLDTNWDHVKCSDSNLTAATATGCCPCFATGQCYTVQSAWPSNAILAIADEP